MQELEHVSSLIGDIYDAALDQSLWPATIERIAGFVGAVAGCLLTQDVAQTMGKVQTGSGDQPRYRQLYFDTYVRLDPIHPALSCTSVGDVISNSDVTPGTEFLDTRFYQEWMRPQGWVDNIFAPLAKSPTGVAAFALARGERDGMADDGVRQRMRLLVPHMRRAVLINSAIDLKTAEIAAVMDALESLNAGIFLVDSAGYVVHANATGHAMLARGSALRAPGGKLVATHMRDASALEEVLAATRSEDASVGTKGIAAMLSSGEGERYVAHVLPLVSTERRQAAAVRGATAAIFVRTATRLTVSPPEIIAKGYNLTPSELRVLLAIVDAGGVQETAEALGIAAATVKTHLQRLFSKTGTNRQVDLVKLVAGFSSPFLGRSPRASD
jgi:DNA-binding CsgD family transcriptional regulator